MQELKECHWLQLTGDTEWEPHSPTFAEQERLATENYDYGKADRDIFMINVNALNANYICIKVENWPGCS